MMLAVTRPFYDNTWLVGIVTGLIVAVVVGAPAIMMRWLRKQLAVILKEVRPNGGETLSSGDTMQRVERKVDALIVTVATQKGHTDAVEDEVFTRLGKLETRKQVEERIRSGA